MYNHRVVHSSLDLTLKALADPTRRAMVAQLGDGPQRVKDLAAPLDLTQQAVSKHLAVLGRAGLISKDRRGREHWCQLETPPLDEAAHWIE